jgi:glucose-1-phosphate cytidylyltransferase
VKGFQEKPRLDHWVNGGFFVFEPSVLDYLTVDSVLEQDPLRRLAAEDRLHAYRHEGFWDCMDTYKDAVTLNDLWEDGAAPWAVWERETEPGPGETGEGGPREQAGTVRG